MGVSKNRGTPKWMVYNGRPYQNGWFGGTTIFGNIHMCIPCYSVSFLNILAQIGHHILDGDTPPLLCVEGAFCLLPRFGGWSTSMALEIPSFVNVSPKKYGLHCCVGWPDCVIVWLTEMLMCLNLNLDTSFPNAYARMPVVGRDLGCFKSQVVWWLGIDGIEVWFVPFVSQTCLGFPQDSGQNLLHLPVETLH